MSETITLDANKLKDLVEQEKDLEIISANIKDLYCNYGYELLTGRNIGDVIPNRKGAHLIHDDLKEAFSEMDVFLAHIDGAYNSWSNNQTAIQELEAHEDLANYYVSAMKITGVEENKAIVISGTKTTVHGDISFSTPKIKLQSTYLYIEELELRIATLISEVEQYMDGKRAPEFEQLDMGFDDVEEANFDEAKVN